MRMRVGIRSGIFDEKGGGKGGWGTDSVGHCEV